MTGTGPGGDEKAFKPRHVTWEVGHVVEARSSVATAEEAEKVWPGPGAHRYLSFRGDENNSPFF